MALFYIVQNKVRYVKSYILGIVFAMQDKIQPFSTFYQAKCDKSATKSRISKKMKIFEIRLSIFSVYSISCLPNKESVCSLHEYWDIYSPR